jgi:hypothetical protein
MVIDSSSVTALNGHASDLQVCVALYAVLLGVQSALIAFTRQWHALLLVGLSGLGLCAGDLAFDLPFLISAALVLAAFLLIATAGVLLVEMDLLPTDLRLARVPLAYGSTLATSAFVAGLALLVGSGVLAGLLLGSQGSAKQPRVFVSGEYRVGGTCVNGACTVNECTSPDQCGLRNHGRLPEGAPLDIVCQTAGEVVTAPNGRSSTIWDRLSSGLYVSDLFVEGTRTDRFAHGLPRCSIA